MKEEKIKKKINYFYDNMSKVHVTLNNKTFYNGFISDIRDDAFIIEEDKLGRIDVFMDDVYDLNTYIIKKEEE